MPQNDFWKRLEGINAGMLGIEGAGRFVPMSHYPDQETQKIWFISAKGTEMAEAAEAVATCAYLVADASKGLYAHAVGALTLSNDRTKLEELWNPIASSWYEQGMDDPDLRLLCLSVLGAEAWLTPASSARFLFEIARAKVTGNAPDMGEHLTFGAI